MKGYLASWAFGIAMLATACAGDGQRSGTSEGDHEKIQGTWQLVKFDAPPGKQPPEAVLAKMQMVFTMNRIVTRVDGKVVEETTFNLDATKSPKWIDVISSQGTSKGKTAQGIYELKGDDLTICIGPSGQNRPTEFKVISD